MDDLSARLELIDRHVTRAMAAVEHDPGTSPVLRAVVLEFQRKSSKNRAVIAAGMPVREAIAELEQAADSARVAAEADPGASEETRKLVDVAHEAACRLKQEIQQQG